MNVELLKELYRHYWEQRDQDQWWYNEYKKTVGMVGDRSKTLAQTPLSATADKDLLEWLIEEKSSSGNGISNARLCMLSHRNYERLVSDDSFLLAATNYMQAPTQNHFEDLVSSGRGGNRRHQRRTSPGRGREETGGNALFAVQQIRQRMQP